MGWLYYRFGGTAVLGNNRVIDEVNSNRAKIPRRMAPLVLLGTIVTHLCGGAAGREGTAIQMGASLADGLRRLLKLTGEGIIPCLVASFVSDLVARARGDARVGMVALEPAVTVTGETPLTALLPLLHSALQMRTVVADVDGAPIGMISESGLLTHVAPEQRADVQCALRTGSDTPLPLDQTAATLMTTPVISVTTEQQVFDAVRLSITTRHLARKIVPPAHLRCPLCATGNVRFYIPPQHILTFLLV